MSLDISEGYKEAQDRIQATKTYKELKDNYDNLKKRAGDSFENKKEQITQTLDQIKENKKSFERKVKSQFDHLLDTFTITNGGVFGSMMGTPIINLPQSAILGMHATKVRPVVVGG